MFLRTMVALAGLGIALVQTGWSAGYPPPTVAKVQFSPAATGLAPSTHRDLARRLAGAAVTLQTADDPGLLARLHAVAVRLSPEDEELALWFQAWSQGEAPAEPPAGETLESVAAMLVELTQRLHLSERPGSVSLARYLVQLAAALRPGNEDIRFEADLVRYLAGAASWDGVLDPALDPNGGVVEVGPNPGGLPRFAQIASEFRLVGLPAAGPPRVVTLGARVRPKAPQAAADVVFREEPGEPLRAALVRALAVVRPRIGSGWPHGQDAVLGLGARDGIQAPADAALGLVVAALAEGIPLDPAAAALGQLDPAGAMVRGDHLPRLIRTASEQGIKVLILPAAAQWDLLDAILLYPRDSLWTTQMIGAATFEEALNAARVEGRPANLALAMAQFDQVAALLAADPRQLANPSTKARLDEVVKLAPQHMSADFLIRGIEGRLPRTLSQASSQVRVAQEIRPLLRFGFSDVPMDEVRTLLPSTPEVDRVGAALEELRPLLHSQVGGMARASASLAQAVRALHDTYRDQPTMTPALWRNRLQAAQGTADAQRKSFREEAARLQFEEGDLQRLARLPR